MPGDLPIAVHCAISQIAEAYWRVVELAAGSNSVSCSWTPQAGFAPLAPTDRFCSDARLA